MRYIMHRWLPDYPELPEEGRMLASTRFQVLFMFLSTTQGTTRTLLWSVLQQQGGISFILKCQIKVQ